MVTYSDYCYLMHMDKKSTYSESDSKLSFKGSPLPDLTKDLGNTALTWTALFLKGPKVIGHLTQKLFHGLLCLYFTVYFTVNTQHAVKGNLNAVTGHHWAVKTGQTNLKNIKSGKIYVWYILRKKETQLNSTTQDLNIQIRLEWWMITG